MKRLNISDSDVMEIALQNEILRSEDARYDHRLHGVLLVCRGFTSYEVAKMFGQNPTTIQLMLGTTTPRYCGIFFVKTARYCVWNFFRHIVQNSIRLSECGN